MRNRASGQALIESIKLQREWEEKAKADRKKEKREKKREKRKEKRKEKEDISSYVSQKEVIKLERDEVETEQLEKSGITEEHEQPSQSPCYLSDSRQSGNKRKRPTSQPNGTDHDHGNIIRIRLPLRKHREPEESNSKEQLPSTSGRAESLVQENDECIHPQRQPHCHSTSSEVNRFSEVYTAGPCKELTSSTGRESWDCL
ncbi:JHL20J20.12 protein [Quillaja saponaria]|uniref:JHL20J20.12 protein n=1 Tax=Quillaja saponaria TaxID=32244 RepID=A0AAD7LGR0_QUISA|nr:JHL20J20.12 protein [Quillaja saponaria]